MLTRQHTARPHAAAHPAGLTAQRVGQAYNYPADVTGHGYRR